MVARLLIDGLAGLAIIAIAVSLHGYLEREGRLRAIMLWAGVAAGLASLGQMIVGEIFTYRAAHGSSGDNVQTLFKVLNNGDTVKIALLAVMIAAASLLARRSGAFPRWLAVGGGPDQRVEVPEGREDDFYPWLGGNARFLAGSARLR